MELWLVRLIIFYLWLFLPPLVFFGLAVRSKLSKAFWLKSLGLFLIWLPIIGVFADFWSITTIFLDRPVRSSITVDPYRVDFVEDTGFIEHERYFEIQRNDGKRARFHIDEDAAKCQGLHVQEVATKTYFLCSGERLSERTSFIDRQQLVVYGGYYQEQQLITTLPFE